MVKHRAGLTPLGTGLILALVGAFVLALPVPASGQVPE